AALYAGTFKVDAREAAAATELRGADGASFKLADAARPREAAGREPPPYRLNGKFSLDHQRLEVQEFRFETGPLDSPYTADGTGLVDLGVSPRFEIEAHGAQVRFDETVAEPGKAEGATLDTRLAGLERMLAGLPKPSIPGTVDVALPAVVAGDTTIRDVRIAAEPATDGWNIKTLSAALPGRTTLEASGLLRTPKEFGFQGSLLLAVGQPSGFASWLSRDVDEAIRRLPAAGFKAKVDLARERQTFRDLELILGKAKFRGEVDSRQPQDTEPSLALKLEGDALDVDGMAAFASMFVSGTGLTELAARNLDLAIKAGPVSVGGLSAETVDTALRLRGDQVEIDRLSIGGLEGATVSATGTLRDLAGEPSGRLDASIVAVDLAPLVKLVSQQYPDSLLFAALAERSAAYPGLFDDTQIDLVGTAAPNGDETSGFAVSAKGDAGGSTLSLAASGKLARGPIFAVDPAAPLSVSFSARNDNAEALMALYGLPVLPLGVVGGGEATLTAKGSL
ncbi:AsmA protein, partial [Rhizobiaceae sp. 2RAB30]